MARPKNLKRARDNEDEVVSEEEVPKSTKKTTTKKAKTTAAATAIGETAEDADGNKYWAVSRPITSYILPTTLCEIQY